MTTNHKLCEGRCNAHLAEWHSLCTQQDITKYVLNESKQIGFPNRKNIFGKRGAMTMCLADLQLEDSNWPRAPTAKLWNLSLYLGQSHSSCGWLPAVADHAGIPKAGSFLGKRRSFWWLAGWLKGFPKTAQPFWDCTDFQDTSNFSSLSLLHLEAELHGHLMALPLLASSLPTFFFINVPWIKSSHG